MDAYLEELIIFSHIIYRILMPHSESKKKHIEDIGRELYADGWY